MANYEANNTYQYVIAREDVHLQWLEAAIAELGATPADVPSPSCRLAAASRASCRSIDEDAREAEALRRPLAAAHAGHEPRQRHRSLLQVVLGETLEHKRFFDQMRAGNADVLGRRSNGPGSPGTGDGVLPVRWIE